MAVRRYQFDGFSLDPLERRLFAGEVLVELNGRLQTLVIWSARCCWRGVESESRTPQARRSPFHHAFAAARPPVRPGAIDALHWRD
jgi:hypothetical protein